MVDAHKAPFRKRSKGRSRPGEGEEASCPDPFGRPRRIGAIQGFKRTDLASRMSAPSSQAGETLSHRPIETFDKRRVQLPASHRAAQHLVSALKGSLRHTPDHFDDALFGRFLDHPRWNVCGNISPG
jgi:hypothetical protein